MVNQTHGIVIMCPPSEHRLITHLLALNATARSSRPSAELEANARRGLRRTSGPIDRGVALETRTMLHPAIRVLRLVNEMPHLQIDALCANKGMTLLSFFRLSARWYRLSG
jgi:hypothetical protein